MKLLRAESMRFWSRALIRWGMVAGLFIAAFVVLGAWQASTPPPAAEVEMMRADFDDQVRDWEENGEAYVGDCKAAEAEDPQSSEPGGSWDCDDIGPPVWEEWSYYETFATSGMATAQYTLYLVVLLALAVGVTFTTAEHSSGALGNWLTFEPRRTRVYWSKVGAAVLGVTPIVLLMAGIIGAGSWWAYDYHGALGALEQGAAEDYVWACVRSAVLSLAVAAAGVALGTLLRHTAIVIGVVVAWMALVEGFAMNTIEVIKPWSILTSIQAWVWDGTMIYRSTCSASSGSGMTCEYFEQPITLLHGGLEIAAVVITLLVAAWLVFRRRDVS